MEEETITLWDKIKSLNLSLNFHPFDWHLDAGCCEVNTYIAIGPVGITLTYWGE